VGGEERAEAGKEETVVALLRERQIAERA